MQPRLLREPIRLAGQPLLRLQSDERLVRLVRDGHQPAFTTIVDRHGPALQRYCARLVGEQRAEDAVQQAFANAHRALTEHDDAVELRPWLYRIAHNAALNTLRGDTDGWSLDDPATDGASLPAAGGPGGYEDVETTVVQRERLRVTLTTIAALPPSQRDALVLRELEGRSHEEIAGVLGVTAGAARQHLMRARAAVRAAATAVTPYPMLVKLAGWMTVSPTGERLTQVAAGAGFGAGIAKVSAGFLATGAIVGGAVGVQPMVSDAGREQEPSGTAVRGAARPVWATAATAAPSSVTGTTRAVVSSGAGSVAAAAEGRPPRPSTEKRRRLALGTGSGAGRDEADRTRPDDVKGPDEAPRRAAANTSSDEPDDTPRLRPSDDGVSDDPSEEPSKGSSSLSATSSGGSPESSSSGSYAELAEPDPGSPVPDPDPDLPGPGGSGSGSGRSDSVDDGAPVLAERPDE